MHSPLGISPICREISAILSPVNLAENMKSDSSEQLYEKTAKKFYPRLGAPNRPLDCSAIYFGGLTGLQFQDDSDHEGIERAHQPGRGPGKHKHTGACSHD